MFELRAEKWGQVAYLKATNTLGFGDFGRSVAVSGDRVLVGAPGDSSGATEIDGDDSDNDDPGSGAAFAFRPLAPKSPLGPVSSITLTPAGLTLTIPSVPPEIAGLIGVEYSPNMLPGSWIDLGDFSKLNGVNTFTDSDPSRLIGRSSGYYRVIVRENAQ